MLRERPQLEAPQPIRAWHVYNNLLVQFDADLVGVPIDAAAWDAVIDGYHYYATDDGQLADTDTVLMDMIQGDPMAGPNRVTYSAAPASVQGLISGLYAPPFADYPLTTPP